MDLRRIIQEYLTTAQMMHIGTDRGNKPWVTTVYFAADIELNLYWLSRKSRRHSQDISKNPHVSAAIVLPHNYGDKVRGVQIEGEARELLGVDADAGRNIYKSKYWIVEDRIMTAAEGGDPQVCYQVRPTKILLYDEVNYPESPSQEFKF
jgi:uncharacterized protein YhbP (UPF0306 family)